MTGTYIKIGRDQFIRQLKQNIDLEHVVLLGAGASQSSGVLTAKECIWKWKEELYKSANANELGANIRGEVDKITIQSWLDKFGIHPEQDDPSEYIYYAENVYLNNEGRRIFFEKLFEGKLPGIGYKILTLFALRGTFKIIMTTNFDGLVTKALQSEGVNVKEITIETASLIHKPMSKNSVYSVALHGDYKYDALKNTGTELDNQSEDFKYALKRHLYNKHLIVSGYSGRDKSLMDALEAAFREKGGGSIFWCAYGQDVLPEVDELLKRISTYNRDAYLVVSGDFDESFKAMGRFCFNDDDEFSRKLDSLVSLISAKDGKVVTASVEPAVDEKVSIDKESNNKNRINLSAYTNLELDALMVANLIGQWRESEKDLSTFNKLSIDYSSLVKSMRDFLQAEIPLVKLLNGKVWTVNFREYLWSSLKKRIFDNHINSIQTVCIDVLSEIDPKFDLEPELHYTASMSGRIFRYSKNIRQGLAETLAWLGVNGDLLNNCSFETRNYISLLAIREIFSNASWQLWGSLNELLPVLAEASPKEFLNVVESALDQPDCPFDHLFANENAGIMGQNYLTGLYWALETLAWDGRHLSRVCVVLAKLSEHDPGGNYANRPSNSIRTILLPWYPQTLASVEMRISAFKAIKNDFPDIAWKVLLGLLPNSRQTSMGTRKPQWRNPIPDDWKPTVIDAEYTLQVIQYSEFAVEMAQSDSEKLVNLIENLNSLVRPSFEVLLNHISSGALEGVSEDVRYQVWSKLVDFASKHRRFPDADWVMPPEAISLIESTAEAIKPVDIIKKYKRLFDSRDHDLYEGSENWREQQVRIEKLREQAIREVYKDGGIKSVFEMVDSLESAMRVGSTLGSIDEIESCGFILPEFINSDLQQQVQLAGNYVWARYRSKGWQWVDELKRADWSLIQNSNFLTFLPFTTETWSRAKDWLGDASNLYWESVRPNPYENDEGLNFAIEMLIEAGRPLAAIDCLHAQVNKKLPLDSNLAIKALKDAIHTNEPIKSMDSYDIVELIKALQETPDIDVNDVCKLEWSYLQLLDRHSGATPKFLERELATNPEYFCFIIQLIYRSDKDDDTEVKDENNESEADSNRKANATNAWRLLHEWDYPPGMYDDGHFSAEKFQEWLSIVIDHCKNTGHLDVAMIEVGGVLFHVPPDDNGLWINEAVAKVLNETNFETLRRGFTTAIFNSRGVHTVDPSGKPEREIAEHWRRRANEIELLGLVHFAEALKATAETYDQEAERVIRESARE